MAFIKMATRFGTQSFYSNGQLIGLTSPNACRHSELNSSDSSWINNVKAKKRLAVILALIAAMIG